VMDKAKAVEAAVRANATAVVMVATEAEAEVMVVTEAEAAVGPAVAAKVVAVKVEARP